MRRVLLIESQEVLRKRILVELREEGIDAEAVSGATAACPMVSEGKVDCVVIGGRSAAVREIVEAGAQAGVAVDVIVALTSDDRVAGLAAIRQGATDFVSLFAGASKLATAIQKAEARRSVRAGVLPPEGPAASGTGAWPAVFEAPALVGTAASMVALLSLVRRLAPVRTNVLIGGESGTGKELVARALHDQSPWRAGPFVPVNCGAIPAGLVESELFGHVRGAFTDAIRDRRGLFEAANGGTLFLDEIADLPLALQPKLLRAIQEGEIRRVGDGEDLRVAVRVVAATARDLQAEVAAGRFREDLYYRLSALSVEIPALRNRSEDIPALAEYFLERARRRLGIVVRGISDAAMQVLLAHPWPGNVRELENTIERAAVMCAAGEIDVASLPERLSESLFAAAKVAGAGTVPALANGAAATEGPGGHGGDAGDGDLSIKRAARASEEDLIRRALARTLGNRTRAAELLEISQRALLYKIKEYGIIPATATRTAQEGK